MGLSLLPSGARGRNWSGTDTLNRIKRTVVVTSPFCSVTGVMFRFSWRLFLSKCAAAPAPRPNAVPGDARRPAKGGRCSRRGDRPAAAQRGTQSEQSRARDPDLAPRPAPCPNSRRPRTADALPADDAPLRHHHRRRIGRVLQRLRREMRIPLGHLGVAVPQDALHLVQRPAAIDEERGELVTQVMNAQLR